MNRSPTPVEPFSIRPRTGYEDILLGVTREAVRALRGEPDSVCREEKPHTGKLVEIWKYDESALMLMFASEHDWRLDSISVSHSQAAISKVPMIGLKEPELLEALEQIGITDLALLHDSPEFYSRIYVSKNSELSFHLNHGSLTLVSIEPETDALDENPQWPATN